MAWTTELTDPAEKDFAELDGSLRRLVGKQFDKLETHPESGKTLGNRMGMDLSGYRALYFLRKGYRIVYKLLRDRQVIEVWGIGRRDKEFVYHLLSHRT